MTTHDETTQAGVEAAAHHLLEAFAAVAGAPDDEQVAEQANHALRHLDDLLAESPL